MKKEIILSTIIGVIIGGLIFGSMGVVFALTYRASDITYTPTDNTWNVSTVGEAINALALTKTSDNYSSTEKVVGSWVDGKPIYQKTLVVENISSTYTKIDSSLNKDEMEIINLTGNAISVSDSVITIWDIAEGNSYWYTKYELKNDGLYYYRESNSINKLHLTVQYTKVADTVSN